MRRIAATALFLSFVILTWAATPTTKAPAKKSTGTAKNASKSATKKAPSKTAARKAPATTWRNRQLAPTQARYREIQEALASKGYLQAGDVSGQWNQTSVDALKRFQADQSIESSGKINSLSLIALGLGPKRDNTAAAKPPAAAQ